MIEHGGVLGYAFIKPSLASPALHDPMIANPGDSID